MSPVGPAGGCGYRRPVPPRSCGRRSELAKRGDLSTIESAGPNDRIDAAGYLIGVGAWSDRTVDALKPFVGDPPQLFTAAVNTPEYLTS